MDDKVTVKTTLINMLRENSECNFIAYGNTVLHACGIDAAVKYLHNIGIDLNGYILMGEHGVTGRVLTRKHFVTKDEGIEYLNIIASEYRDFANKSRRVRLFLKNSPNTSRVIYVVRTEIDPDWHTFIQYIFPDAKIIHIIIDDGAATYEDPSKSALQYLRLNGEKGIGRLVQYPYLRLKLWYRVFCLKMWKRKYERNGEYICGAIYNKNVNKNGKIEFQKNEPFSKLYSEVFMESPLVISEEFINMFESTILVNTQCLKENNLTDGKVDYKVLQDFLRCVEDSNTKVIIKPHPREQNPQKYEGLGCGVVYERVSQEVILARLKQKPKCIVSFYSSLLLNAYGLFNVPAISLARMLMKEDISQALRIELDEYYRNYKSVIYFPENYNELKELLKRILR